MQIACTTTESHPARLLSRFLARIIRLDAAFREAQKLAQTPPDRLRDMGISVDEAIVSVWRPRRIVI